jgi:hypothetical protein
VTLFPRHVHLAPRIVKPRLTKWPAGHENGWASIPRAGVGPLPIVSPNHDLELPPWWVTYPNDVPK